MNLKLFKYIILMTIIVAFVWIVGEVLIVAIMKLSGTASVVWSIAMLITAIVLGLYKSLKKDDENNNRNW